MPTQPQHMIGSVVDPVSTRMSIVTKYGRITHVYMLPEGTTRNQALGIARRWKKEHPEVTYSVCAPIEVIRP